MLMRLFRTIYKAFLFVTLAGLAYVAFLFMTPVTQANLAGARHKPLHGRQCRHAD